MEATELALQDDERGAVTCVAGGCEHVTKGRKQAVILSDSQRSLRMTP